MYRRIVTALIAAVLAALLLFVLGPMGANAGMDPGSHIVAQVK